MVIVNGEVFNNEQFHNGEVIFKGDVSKLDTKSDNVIILVFEDNKDITNLAFAKKWIEDKVGDTYEVPCYLIMQYCPYERMDREINDQLFSLKYFAKIIADMHFSAVYVLDPHSKVLKQEFKAANINLIELDLEDWVSAAVREFKPDYICYPDKGAASKYPELLSNIDLPFFFGNKQRDLNNNGRIVNTELVNAPDLKGKRVLIIDDICCLGGTAYNVAKLIKESGASKVAFYISHCENGIYVGNILKPTEADEKEQYGEYVIDKVYTANTMNIPIKHENIITLGSPYPEM